MANFFILISDMNVNCDMVLRKRDDYMFENSILPNNLFSRKQDMLAIWFIVMFAVSEMQVE